MKLTKRYSNGSYGVAENLPCGENSYEFKNLLINKVGEYEHEIDMIWCTIYNQPCIANETFANKYPTICNYSCSGECESIKIYYKKLTD